MDNMRSASPAIDEEVPLPCNSEHNESLTEMADQLYASSVSNHLRRSITESITEEGNVEDEGECGDGDDSSRRRASSFASDDVSNDLDKRYQDSEALLESLGESPSEADLTKVTTARVSEIVREQAMEDRVRFANIPRFTKSDVLIGRHLGKGCFSDVFEVTVTLENDQSQMGEGTSLELNNRIRAKFGNSVGASSKPSTFDYKPVNKNALPPVFKVGGGSSHCSGASDHSSDVSDDEEDLDKFIDANFGGGDFDRSASAPPDDGEDLDALIEAKFGGGYVDRSASAPPPGSSLDKFSDCRRSSDPATINEDAEDKADVGTDFKPTQLHRPSSRQRRVTTDLSSSVCVGSVSAARRTMGRSRRLNLAMKCLRPICRSDAQKFMIGVEDLVHETVILSSIDHPNIIKIHGRAELGEGYFILLDKLKDTLEDRIEGWRKMFPQSSRNPPSINQVKVAKTLADTVAFLHDRNIVFHDLKPPNVGFDERGQLKLFDFGFAVEVVDDEPLEDKAGTVRYMSPEVGLDLGHGLPSDVYSFSILLWEIFSLKKPFAKIKSPNEFKRIVFDGGERPKLGKNWPVEMKEEIERGWSDKPNQRPSMDDFAKLLSKWQSECPTRAKTHNDKSLRGSIVRMKSRMSWDA
jgi:serine/threonine protein kinase